MQKFTVEEVAKHNTKADLWIIVNKQVYNVTKFMNDHPGGGSVFLDVAGRDASSDFADVGHSSDAIKQMQKYLIGTL